MDWDEILKIIIFMIIAIGSPIVKKIREKRRARAAPPLRRQGRPAPAHPILDPVLEEAEQVLEEAEQVLGEHRDREETKELVPFLERGFLRPLRHLAESQDVRGGIVESYQVYWNLVRLGLEQRTGSAGQKEAVFLRDLDALADGILQSVTSALGIQGSLAVRRLMPVLVHESYRSPAYRLPPIEMTGIAPVPIPEGAREDVWRWAALYHHLAHLVWEHHPAVQEEVARVTRLGGRRSGMLGFGLISQQHLVRMLAATWLPELFADILTAAALGPAAAESARNLYRGRAARDISLIRSGAGEYGAFEYDSHPPPVLRFALILRVLSLGSYEEEAEKAWDAWIGEHGNPDVVHIELPGQFARPIPIDPFVDELDRIADRLLSTRFRTLGGNSLAEMPGLPLPREEFERIDRAAARHRPERALRDPSARGVVVFAVQAAHHHARSAADPARRLLAHVVRGEPIVKPTAAVRTAASAEGEVSLREVMSEAIVWREILRPPVVAR